MLFNVSNSGISLNFKVVSGATQPASPKENTIWVKSAIGIPYWVTAPSKAAPSDGDNKGTVTFWWESATAAEVSGTTAAGFMPIKNNATNPPGYMRLKPINCYQNQNGAKTGWKRMDAYIYKSGTWVQFSKTFDGNLFNYGPVNTDVTGGWKSDGGGSVTAQSDGSVLVEPATNHSEGIYHTVNKIDLSGYSKLAMNGCMWEQGGNYRTHICVWSEVAYGDYEHGLVASLSNVEELNSSTKNYTLDVSGLTGSYYIGVAVTDHPAYGSITMNTMKLT